MQNKIIIKGAREHNLKNINLELPRDKMIVFTGLSGSGKSSLAFDTIFAEGQRRYIESLSAYARQFLGKLDKPDVDEIEGLSPAISIDQKSHSHNPRSTVATITEIYDYLRVLFARVGIPFCPICGKEIRKMTNEEIVDIAIGVSKKQMADKNLVILAPVVRGRKGEYYQMLYDFLNSGFREVRVDGEYHSLRDRLELSRYKTHSIDLVVDRLPSGLNFRDKNNRLRLAEAIENALKYGHGVVTIITDKEVSVSAKFTCPEDGFSFPEIEPRLFSFNSPYGACPECHGLGTEDIWSEKICPKCAGKRLRDESLSVLIKDKNIASIVAFSIGEAYAFFNNFADELLAFSLSDDMSLQPIQKIQKSRSSHSEPFVRHSDPAKAGEESRGKLREESHTVKSSLDRDSSQSLGMTGSERSERNNRANLLTVAEVPLREIKNRLKFMIDVGLEYLTLERKAGTLAGGEAQRIRLASQIGSRLVGTLYILDEPTIGLHQRDNAKLIKTLHQLRDLGNTILVVEHDEETIRSADYLVDIGPAAGVHGGKIVAQGPMPEILQDKKHKSLTLDYLRGIQFVTPPKEGRPILRSKKVDYLKIQGATANNLQDIDVEIPLKRFTAVTGLSGSGKSTLVYDVLYKALANKWNGADYKVGPHKAMHGLEHINRVINIDQSPIGRTPRSNPATYVGAWTYVRDLFSATEDARVRGYKPGRFSFNVRGGRCENCEGHGTIAIEMHFLPTVYVECDVCRGKRFDRETLEVRYRGKNIYEVLRMTIEEAADLFHDIPWLHDRLRILDEVGLGYLELGQSATTLSGGEAQRVKLGAELGKRDTHRTLYLLDEPTTGLHFADVQKLIDVLQRLVDRGNTVVVIEHNLDVIKCADWVIALGPEGGDKGGKIVGTGTPEDIARRSGSFTGEYLRKVLK